MLISAIYTTVFIFYGASSAAVELRSGQAEIEAEKNDKATCKNSLSAGPSKGQGGVIVICEQNKNPAKSSKKISHHKSLSGAAW